MTKIIPEKCSLVAVQTGDGWLLEVQDRKGDEVAYLRWPHQWPGKVDANFLRERGFVIF